MHSPASHLLSTPMVLLSRPSELAISGTPRPPCLPEDLEREILLLAASEDSKSIASLVRVAKRTQLWLDPLLYRVLLLLEYSDGLAFIEDHLKRKPDSVWRDGPRHLYLSLGDDERTVCALETLLRKYTEVEDLNFFLPAYQPRRFLAPLDEMMNLKRLHIQLERLFDGALSSIDLSRPAFANLTHLVLFAQLEDCTESDATHLAHHTNSPSSFPHPYRDVPVDLRPDTRRLTVQTMYERELTGVTDVRFVIMPLVIWIREWEDAARGLKESFWTGAERYALQRLDDSVTLVSREASARSSFSFLFVHALGSTGGGLGYRTLRISARLSDTRLSVTTQPRCTPPDASLSPEPESAIFVPQGTFSDDQSAEQDLKGALSALQLSPRRKAFESPQPTTDTRRASGAACSLGLVGGRPAPAMVYCRCTAVHRWEMHGSTALCVAANSSLGCRRTLEKARERSSDGHWSAGTTTEEQAE
ncbi:hypothetical protein C8F01DRAFT_1295450 [Mycena amicta]|nr:hypothetical protein C8F01DRAFT_1295450 [Mycena amicta]